MHCPIGPNPTLIHARVLPELASDFDRVDTGRPPPHSFVAGAMNGPVMYAAKRDREFVTGLAPQRPRLHVSKMMGVRRLAPAHEACLLGNIAEVLGLFEQPENRLLFGPAAG